MSIKWLINGEGEMFTGNVTSLSQKQHKKSSNVDGFVELEPWDSKTPLNEDEVEVPFYMEVELSAGIGSVIQLETTGPKLRFSRSSLRKHGVDYNAAACVKVSGNSMEPVIPDGATVGVDTANTAIKDCLLYTSPSPRD